MNDSQLDSALNDLPQPLLPPGLRDRTLAAFDQRRPKVRHLPRFYKWMGLAAAVLCVVVFAATMGAFQVRNTPPTWEIYKLEDGNVFAVKTVFHPTSISTWLSLFTFRMESGMREGQYQQIFHLRGSELRLGYRVKPQAAEGSTYNLIFSKTVNPPSVFASIPAHSVVKVEEPFVLGTSQTGFYTCFIVSRTGVNLPECEPPPEQARVQISQTGVTKGQLVAHVYRPVGSSNAPFGDFGNPARKIASSTFQQKK